jgi:hypothetical protein
LQSILKMFLSKEKKYLLALSFLYLILKYFELRTSVFIPQIILSNIPAKNAASDYKIDTNFK